MEAQAQGEGSTVLLITVLSAQQVLVEVRQGQAGPEVRAQHADWRQHDGGIGHRACRGTVVRQATAPATPQTSPTVQVRPDHFPLIGPASQHPARWLGCGYMASRPLSLPSSFLSPRPAPSHTFEGHRPDALFALDVPEAHSLIM